LLAVFNARIIEKFSDKRKSQEQVSYRYTWKIKDAFKWGNIYIKSLTCLMSFWAFNALVALINASEKAYRLTLPTLLESVLRVYSQYLYIFIGLVFAVALLVAIIQLIQNMFLVPITVKNNTDQTLSVFIRNQLIGVAEPGEAILNNKFPPFSKTYLLTAKNQNEGEVFSKEYHPEDLIQLDGRIEISGK